MKGEIDIKEGGWQDMSRRRVYRHDIRCPHCGSNWCIKYGKANVKQTYKCKDCFHRFIPDLKELLILIE